MSVCPQKTIPGGGAFTPARQGFDECAFLSRSGITSDGKHGKGCRIQGAALVGLLGNDVI